jgi:hypothetical protein
VLTFVAAGFMWTGRLKRWHGVVLLALYVAYWVISYVVYGGRAGRRLIPLTGVSAGRPRPRLPWFGLGWPFPGGSLECSRGVRVVRGERAGGQPAQPPDGPRTYQGDRRPQRTLDARTRTASRELEEALQVTR